MQYSNTHASHTIPGFLPGSASLVEQLDKRLLLVLRDGRHLIGVLRSLDQFCNFALEDTLERRIHVKNNICYYVDVPLGVFLVRGDSVVILGEMAPEDDVKCMAVMKEVSLAEFEAMREENIATTGDEITWDVE